MKDARKVLLPRERRKERALYKPPTRKSHASEATELAWHWAELVVLGFLVR